MGNPHDGDAWQSAGKANRTSSRKIYSVCCHFSITTPPGPGSGAYDNKGFDLLDTPDKQPKKKQQPQKPRLVDTRWVATIMPVSFALSVGMSYLSNEALNSAGTMLSFLVLFFFIALGIVFDMIGIAAASGTEREFHSMAAHKVRGAREAVWMLRNAEKVSSICNDVVGDICGIISGATGALIVANITAGMSGPMTVVISLVVTGMVSALTIGGKAAGKGVAMAFSSKVLALCGRLLSVLPFSFDAKK